MAPATEAPASTTAEGPTQHVPNQLAALAKLSAPFATEQISKLPKVTCGQCRDHKFKVCDKHDRRRCDDCQGNLTTAHIHLDYVGHADITLRLLEVDPLWTWEPLAFDADGLPKFDQHGGMWIRLTVAGHTRLGYGDAQGKKGPNAVKEVIGDALRNAAMRFGAGTALWSKSDAARARAETKALSVEPTPEEQLDELVVLMRKRWSHTGGLTALRQQLDRDGFAEAQVPDLTGEVRLFGELVDGRIAELEKEAALKATVNRFAAAVRKDYDSAQALTKRKAEAAELGILDRQVPGPDAVIVSIDHLLTARINTLTGASASTPEQAPAPAATAPQGDERAAHLRRLMSQVSNNQTWNSPDALRQIKGDAEEHQVFDEQVQGPDGTWMPMRTLVTVRIAELEQAAAARNERSVA